MLKRALFLKMILLILMSLLSEKTIASTHVTKLKYLTPAPYDGMLLTEEIFRFYVNTKDSCLITDEALDRCHADLSSKGSDLVSSDTIIIFVLGALACHFVKC